MSFLQLRSRRIQNPLANGSPSAPSVTTQAASSIATTSATGNGTVTSDGGSSLTERGFVWSTSPNPTTSDSKVADGSSVVGVYSDTLSPLITSTLYHYRAYAINALGTSYGADTTFTTSGAIALFSSLLMMMGVG